MHPIIFSIGPLTVYSFGVMLAIAFLTAGNVVQRELVRKGLDPELASSFMVWAAVGGLVGSRVLSFIDDWSGFLADPLAVYLQLTKQADDVGKLLTSNPETSGRWGLLMQTSLSTDNSTWVWIGSGATAAAATLTESVTCNWLISATAGQFITTQFGAK